VIWSASRTSPARTIRRLSKCGLWGPSQIASDLMCGKCRIIAMPMAAVGLTQLITHASGQRRSTSFRMAFCRGTSRSVRNVPPGPMVSAEHMIMPCFVLAAASTPRSLTPSTANARVTKSAPLSTFLRSVDASSFSGTPRAAMARSAIRVIVPSRSRFTSTSASVPRHRASLLTMLQMVCRPKKALPAPINTTLGPVIQFTSAWHPGQRTAQGVHGSGPRVQGKTGGGGLRDSNDAKRQAESGGVEKKRNQTDQADLILAAERPPVPRPDGVRTWANSTWRRSSRPCGFTRSWRPRGFAGVLFGSLTFGRGHPRSSHRVVVLFGSLTFGRGHPRSSHRVVLLARRA